MTDKELLELAAKAAGYSVRTDITYADGVVVNDGAIWNPLTDDGDALRLAVKMNLLIDSDYNGGVGVGSASFEEVWEGKENDPYAATRRAIVRATAEIGKGMK